MRIAAQLALALSLVLLAGVPARADDPARPPGPTPASPTAGPIEVTLGFCVFDVRDVDLRGQSFFADFYLWTRYSAPPEKGKEIEKFEFMNGKTDSREELDRKTVDGQTYVCWRMNGTFHFQTMLQSYPFDSQSLDIMIEQPTLEVEEVVFKDDARSYGRSGLPVRLYGVKEDLDIPEFTLRETRRTIVPNVYQTDFGDLGRTAKNSTYSRYTLSMVFARDFMPYLFKILVPLLVIILMAYLVFFLPAKEIQSASGMGIAALLSAIAFNISIAQNLPDVGYLVVSDKFFISTYLVLLLTLGQSVFTYVWDDRGEGERAARWLYACRIVFPILYVSIFSYLLVQALFSRGVVGPS